MTYTYTIEINGEVLTFHSGTKLTEQEISDMCRIYKKRNKELKLDMEKAILSREVSN